MYYVIVHHFNRSNSVYHIVLYFTRGNSVYHVVILYIKWSVALCFNMSLFIDLTLWQPINFTINVAVFPCLCICKGDLHTVNIPLWVDFLSVGMLSRQQPNEVYFRNWKLSRNLLPLYEEVRHSEMAHLVTICCWSTRAHAAREQAEITHKILFEN